MTNRIEDYMNKPLAGLGFHVRLRRHLMNSGFATLSEALAAPRNELEDSLNDVLYREWNDLLRAISENDVGAIAGPTSEQREERAKATRRILAAAGDNSIARRRVYEHESPVVASTYAKLEKENEPLPNEPFVRNLEQAERKAKNALSSIADHADTALVAEAFPMLIGVDDELESGFRDLFNRYQKMPMRALTFARLYFPNAFIVLISFHAKKDFDGDSFWKTFFDEFAIMGQTAQNETKRVFYQGIVDKGFPFFSSGDNDFRFLYTALLHGGFSESFWRPMWSDVLLPYARRGSSSWLLSRSGSEVIREMRAPGSPYAPSKAYARRIIEKASATMLSPLVESALSVASDVVELEKSAGSGLEMLSSHGLPDAAMDALRQVLYSGSTAKRRLIYLSPAELRLDPSRGVVHLHWNPQILSAEYLGKYVEYRVNGTLRHTARFKAGVGKSMLPECDVELMPNERFDVELVLIDEDKKRVIASLSQTYDRTRPGSFEFVEGGDGLFRLRKKQATLSKVETIAYLIKSNLWVVPGVGMTAVENYDACEQWNGASIQIFEVEPGAAGSIIDLTSKETVACWQENYRVEVDRSHAIGKSGGKRDLYGFSYTKTGTNECLPDIIVEARDADVAMENLAITCICDGERISLWRKPYYDEVDHEQLSSGQLVIKPSESMRFPRFAKDVRITVSQEGSSSPVLDYRFSIVPIRGFGIEELAWGDDNAPIATYSFEAMDSICVPTPDGDYEMVRGDLYYLDAPLSQEASSISVRHESLGCIDASLSLAGIELDVPEGLRRINAVRPINASDGAYVDGKVSLTTFGGRRSRAALAMIGTRPLLYRRIKGKCSYSFDIFKDPAAFESAGSNELMDVELTIGFGEHLISGSIKPAIATISLAGCITGLGLGSHSLRHKDGEMCLRFENPATTDLQLRFFGTRRGEDLGTAEMSEGDSGTAVPSKAAYKISTRKRVSVTISPLSLFGEADESLAETVEITR